MNLERRFDRGLKMMVQANGSNDLVIIKGFNRRWLSEAREDPDREELILEMLPKKLHMQLLRRGIYEIGFGLDTVYIEVYGHGKIDTDW